MKKMQQGFTLIELMIVVAIIGILAAIAIPQYNDYVTRTQVTTALAEVNGGKTAYEERVQRGASLTAESDVGLSDSTRCDISVFDVDSTGAASPAISCQMNGNPTVQNDTIALHRASGGGYSCVYTDSGGSPVETSLLPEGCS